MRIVNETSPSTQKIKPADLLPPFEVEVTSGPRAVRAALQGVFDQLAPLSLDVEETSTVELVLAEALNNIVEHAYPAPDADGPIHLQLQHCADGLHVRLSDRGRAMKDDMLPKGHLERVDCNIADLPEGGFGWFLIKDLSRDVRYTRSDGQNRLSLRIAVGFPQ
ncbi:ATP-binding protein [Sulfitobacter geojensis]|uniref:ATP-binding protein n=1 Tax=Sulfitobacter geojensis TaxID=1342299 RepID=UPI0030B8220B